MFSVISVSGVGLFGSYSTRSQELQWEALPSLCSRGMNKNQFSKELNLVFSQTWLVFCSDHYGDLQVNAVAVRSAGRTVLPPPILLTFYD